MKLSRFFFNIFFVIFFSLLFSIKAQADLSFRNHRFSSFKPLPPNAKGDIVFIGNSITNMMNWNEAFGNHKEIKNRGTSGAFTQEILENLESMIAGEPSKIFLMIGTNDLGTEGPSYAPDAVAYRIKKILSRIRKQVPEAEVYYQSILPSQSGHRNKEKTIATNQMVEEWIKGQDDPFLYYIDLYTPLNENGELKNTVSSQSPDSFSFDGLHLTQKGYKVWLDLINDCVGVENIIPDNAINLWGDLTGSNGMRTTYFGVLPVSSSDILLIGDEFINGAEWDELLNSNDFKNRGSGWGFASVSIDKITSNLSAIFKGNYDKNVTRETPRAVILYAGTNDFLKGSSVEEAVSNYEKLISSLSSLSPSSQIYLMSLVSPGDSYEELNKKILEFNLRIKNLVEPDKNLKYIDLSDALMNNDGERKEELFSGKSSPYISGLGYVAVANEIAKNINKDFNTNYSPISYEEARDNIERFLKNSEIHNQSFTVFDNFNSDIPYRIPAIAKNKDGDLIAVADYRYSKNDIGMAENGKLDLRFRIKDGETGAWSETETLVATIEEDGNFVAFGDPCIVADKESDLVLVTCCSGNVSFPKGTHDNHQGVARFYSKDGGKTWGNYEEIGDQFLKLLDKREDGPVNAFFIGSGKIEQSDRIKIGDYFRIYCSMLVRVNDGKTKVNYVFYSDDFGQNWNLLGDINDCPIPFGADEAKTEELPDGSLLVSSRIKGGRYYNIFRYEDEESGKGKWMNPVVSNSDVNGIIASDNACNGETLLVPVVRKSDGTQTYLLLQSVPMNKSGMRANVGINYKDLVSLNDSSTPLDVAKDWNGRFEVTSNSSAYSSMVLDKDNDIAFFFEENIHNGGYDMVYKKISIEDLTDGKYSFNNTDLK